MKARHEKKKLAVLRVGDESDDTCLDAALLTYLGKSQGPSHLLFLITYHTSSDVLDDLGTASILGLRKRERGGRKR